MCIVDDIVAQPGRRLERSFLLQHFPTIPAMLKGTDIVAKRPAARPGAGR